MLTVSPLVRLQRATDGGFIVAAGQGSGRVQLDVSGTALASWIIGFSGPMSDTDLRASLAELAHLLKHAFGVQRAMPTVWGEALLKTYPSGGARHPLELYVAVRDVAGLEPGIYRYDLRCDELRTVRAGSALSELDAAAHHQA